MRQRGLVAELQRCWKLKRLSAKALMHMKRTLKPTSTAAAGPMKLHLQPSGFRCLINEHLAQEQHPSDRVCLSRHRSRLSRDACIMYQMKQQQCLEDLTFFIATSRTVCDPSEPHGLTGDPCQRTLCSWTHDVYEGRSTHL